jgi:hypothetical protein
MNCQLITLIFSFVEITVSIMAVVKAAPCPSSSSILDLARYDVIDDEFNFWVLL